MGRNDDMILPPPWRTRTSARRRAVAAAVTFALLFAVGFALMAFAMALLGRIGAPAAVTAAPWYVPTLAVLAWNLRTPTPAIAGDEGDESWTIYAIRAVLVGPEARRSRPARAIAAVVFGAPIVWSLLLIGVLSLAGIF